MHGPTEYDIWMHPWLLEDNFNRTIPAENAVSQIFAKYNCMRKCCPPVHHHTSLQSASMFWVFLLQIIAFHHPASTATSARLKHHHMIPRVIETSARCLSSAAAHAARLDSTQ